jgi:hypothetical protein
MLLTILIVVAIVALIGGGYSHSRRAYWGWSPLALVLVVALVLFATGNLGLRA